MKSLVQILTFSLLLAVALVLPAFAEAEEGAASETLPTAIEDATDTELADLGNSAPSEVSARPDPVFLAGSSAGGAGGLKTGLVNGESSNLPRTRILYEDHFCCPYGATSCDCSYLANFFCDPIGCPKRTQPDCSN